MTNESESLVEQIKNHLANGGSVIAGSHLRAVKLSAKHSAMIEPAKSQTGVYIRNGKTRTFYFPYQFRLV